jgi:hypothetical protein
MTQKHSIFALVLVAGLSLPARAQNVRYDAPFPSISSQTSTPFLVANVPPNSPVLAVCHSPANTVPCTNYATTYTSAGAACPNGAQDTPQPQPSACQPTGDGQGNIGFWAPAGTYDYTVCIGLNCYGPYTVTIGGGGGGGGGNINPGTTFNHLESGLLSLGADREAQLRHQRSCLGLCLQRHGLQRLGGANSGQCHCGRAGERADHAG